MEGLALAGGGRVRGVLHGSVLSLAILRPPADRVNDFFQEWASARNYWGGLPIYTDHTVTLPLYLDLDPSNPRYSLIEVNAHPPTSVLLAASAGISRLPAMLSWSGTSFRLECSQ